MADATVTLGLNASQFNEALKSARETLDEFNKANGLTNDKVINVNKSFREAKKVFQETTVRLKELSSEGRKTDEGLKLIKAQENAAKIIQSYQQVQDELKAVQREASKVDIAKSIGGNGKQIGKQLFDNVVGSVNISGLGSAIGAAIGGPAGAMAGEIIGTIGSKVADFGVDCIKASAKVEDLQVSFRTLIGQASRADILFSDIQKYGSVTPYQTEDLAKAAKLMLSFGINTDQIMPTLKQFGDIAMGDNQKLQSLTLAFSQMSSAGRVMKEDLNQMINAGFNPLQVISEKTGESMASLQDKVSKGQISVRQIQEAFRDATSEGGKFHNMAANMSDTMNGKLSTLNDNWEQLKANLGGLGDAAVKSSLSDAINLVNMLNNAVTSLRRSLGDFGSGDDDFKKTTINAVEYANKKGGGDLKKRNKSINRAIYYEEQHQKRLEKAISYYANGIVNYGKVHIRDKNGRLYSKNELSVIQQELTHEYLQNKKRIQYYKDALKEDPYKSTPLAIMPPTTPTSGGKGGKTTTRGSRNTTKGEVIPSGSLAELEKQASEAKKRISLAVGEEAFLEAERAWREAEDKVENYKYNAYKNASNSPVKDIKLPTSTPSSVLYGDDVKPNFNLPSQKDLNGLKLPKIEDTDSYKEGLENIENMLQFLQYNSGTVGDFTNQWAELANAFKLGGVNAETAGAGLAVLGQQLQQIGGNGAIAKMGAVMAAIGQCILGFATASAQAAALGPFGWLAFVGAGLGTLATMVSTIQGFSNGGIVGGATTSGDMQLARVNAGEMILNNSQQARLFDVLDGGTSIARNNGEVEFKISGQALVGTLKNYNNKMMKVR